MIKMPSVYRYRLFFTRSLTEERMKQATKQPQTQRPAQAAPVQKEVRAEAFILVDSAGRKRAHLKTINHQGYNDTVLAFHDEEGHLRLTLRDSWEEATLNLFGQVNGVTEEMMIVGYKGNTVGTIAPGITICDDTGHDRIFLGVRANSEERLTLVGRDDAQTGINADGLTTWNDKDEVVAEVGILSQAEPPTSAAPAGSSTATPARQADGVAALIEDPQREMEAAIDELRFLVENETPYHVLLTELMLLLHRISVQPGMVGKDCLEFAVGRCYHWTLEAQAAQQAHLATLLQTRSAGSSEPPRDSALCPAPDKPRPSRRCRAARGFRRSRDASRRVRA